MDNNVLQLKTYLTACASLMLSGATEAADLNGAMVAGWVQHGHPEVNGSMIAGDINQCVVLIAYMVDKIALTTGTPTQAVLRDVRKLLRQIARERRKMGPGEPLFNYTHMEVDPETGETITK